MTDAQQYQKAITMASRAHEGQTDRGGNEYTGHLSAVADGCESLKAKTTGWLHDILEDTGCTKEDLIEAGFSREIVDAVVLLTKVYDDDFSYEEYLSRIRNNPLACEVKKADLRNNMDLSRLPQVTDRDLEYRKKYEISLMFLEYKLDEAFVFPDEWSKPGMNL